MILLKMPTLPSSFPARILRSSSVHLNISMASLHVAAHDAGMEPSPKIAKLADTAHPASNGFFHPIQFFVKKLSPSAVLPSRASALAAGYDISSAYDDVVPARGKALIKTDLSIAVPEGTYARLAPRSGLAWKHSIDVGAGVIDADYRGPVGVILFNHSDQDFSIKAGDRVAQLILEKIVTPEVVEVQDLEATVRGENGFGSTGITTST